MAPDTESSNSSDRAEDGTGISPEQIPDSVGITKKDKAGRKKKNTSAKTASKKKRKRPKQGIMATGHMSAFPVDDSLIAAMALYELSEEWLDNDATVIYFHARENKRNDWTIFANAEKPIADTEEPALSSRPLLGPYFSHLSYRAAAQLMLEFTMDGIRIAKHNEAENVELQVVEHVPIEPWKGIPYAFPWTLTETEPSPDGIDKAPDDAAAHAQYDQTLSSIEFKQKAEEEDDPEHLDGNGIKAEEEEIPDAGEEPEYNEPPLPVNMPKISRAYSWAAYDFEALHDMDPQKNPGEWQRAFPISFIMTTQTQYNTASSVVYDKRDNIWEGYCEEDFTRVEWPKPPPPPRSKEEIIKAGDLSDAALDEYNGEKPAVDAQQKTEPGVASGYIDDDEEEDLTKPVEYTDAKVKEIIKGDDDDDDDEKEYGQSEEEIAAYNEKMGYSDGIPRYKVLRADLDTPTADALFNAYANLSTTCSSFFAIRNCFPDIKSSEDIETMDNGSVEVVTKTVTTEKEAWYIFGISEDGLEPLMMLEPNPDDPDSTFSERRRRSVQLQLRTALVLRNLYRHEIEKANSPQKDVYHMFVQNLYPFDCDKFIEPLEKELGIRKPPKNTAGTPAKGPG